MSVKSVRRARSTRWLWCLAVMGVLGCKGGCGDEAARPTQTEQAQEARDASTPTGLVRAAPRRPDGGMPDGGRFRHQLEDTGEPGPNGCPVGQFRCCDGSCSADKHCPGVSCDPVPTMRE
ncbi:hypothetical protein P2318_04040 [Myxococcaceae bacterium GXIMD 01537]